jgi:hypothetical protein
MAGRGPPLDNRAMIGMDRIDRIRDDDLMPLLPVHHKTESGTVTVNARP